MAKKKTKSNSNYRIPYSGNDRKTVQRKIRNGIKSGKSPQQIYDDLKESGLGYRKQNVLADIRLKSATINAKSPSARKRAEKWYLNVFEPFREKHKMNSKQTKKAYDDMINASWDTIGKSKRGRELRDAYKHLFKREPVSE